MTLADLASTALVLGGSFFFLAGTVGLLRFPDVYCRLHALCKADNLGLGLIVLGLAVAAPGSMAAAKLILIWLLVLLSSGLSAYLVARAAWEHGVRASRGEG